MYRRLFFTGIAAVTLMSTGCCGPCGGGCFNLCGWYPGKHLAKAFACHGCGGGCGGGYGYGDSGCGAGGCGGGCDGGDVHGDWIGSPEEHVISSPEPIHGGTYYPRSAGAPPKPPSPPRDATTRYGSRRGSIRQTSHSAPANENAKSSCPCGRH